MADTILRHNKEIQKNLNVWKNKPVLRSVYGRFYGDIVKNIKERSGPVVEIGSGIGGFKQYYPACTSTDIFPNTWIDKVESAYDLSFKSGVVGTIVLFDVFHHLAYPGAALKEFKRALASSGRVILFEPYVSLLGLIVYGLLHLEPIALFKKINWFPKENVNPDGAYFAAQGNATRIFSRWLGFRNVILKDWSIVCIKKYSAISYIMSGGFSKPAFFSMKHMPFLKVIEKILDLAPFIFGTRIMIVLEKKNFSNVV